VTNLSTVRPEQGTELVFPIVLSLTKEGLVSKGSSRGRPFDKLSPNGFVERMLRFVASQDTPCSTKRRMTEALTHFDAEATSPHESLGG
jgi:hypothetical protein